MGWMGDLEDVGGFRHDVCRALELGARRGVHIAVLGVPGCRKSLLFEPFDQIFAVMGKPDSNSTFPTARILDVCLLLWQECKHKNGFVLFEDFLALLAGERMKRRRFS